MLQLTVGQLAAQLGATVIGDSELIVSGLAGIAEAKSGDLSFVANPKYKNQLAASKATAVLVGLDISVEHATDERALLQIENPRLAFARVMGLAFPKKVETPGVSPDAHVDLSSQIDPTATLYPGVTVGANSEIGAGTVIYPGCFIGDQVKIGENCLIHPNVTIMHGTVIGSRVVLNASSVLGCEGFGYERDGDKHFKIPQVGSVIIEDDVEIGSMCAIDRGSIQSTIIGSGTKLDNLIHIAHNCHLGPNNLVLSQAGLAGTVKTGTNVYFAGQSGCMDHIKIADRVQVGGRAVVTSDLSEPGLYFGYPAKPHSEWQKASVMFYKTPEMSRRLSELEKQVEKLSKQLEAND